jgi:hypothetical protein
MNDHIDDIKNMWLDARKINESQTADIGQIIAMAENKKKSTVKAYGVTILILMITLTLLLAYFKYAANFRQSFSLIGTGLMLGSLALRILIELVSIYLSNKIKLGERTLITNNASLRFYNFRKKIHNPITIIFIALYSTGFYMLTPEFSGYFSLPMMILIDTSYIILAMIFIWFVRKAIRKEMQDLGEIIRIQHDILHVE